MGRSTVRTLAAAFLLEGLIMSTLSVPVLQLDVTQAVLEASKENLGFKAAGTLPVPNSTRSFWIDTPGANPLAGEGSEGDITKEADVCIIGSGITGVSAAYVLARQFEGHSSTGGRPLKAVILEARDFCSGATGRNGGHLTPHVFQDFAKCERMYGSEEAKRVYAIEDYTAAELVKIIDSENLRSAVDLISGGHIAALLTKQEVEQAESDYSTAKAAGVDLRNVEWLSKENMESTYGTSYPALRYPGHNLWPLKLVTQLYKLAVKRDPTSFSLNLHTRTPVIAITRVPTADDTQRWSLSTPRGDIKCSYVIHATNAYASHLLPHMHGPAGIIPTRGQIIATRANASLSELTTSSWGANQGFEFWFPRPVGGPDADGKQESPLVIMGGGREVTAPNYEYYVNDDSVIREDVGKVLRDFLPGLFPGKFEKGREPEMEWSGIMGFTKLGDPFVGPVLDTSKADSGQFKGQFVAAGYSGHGMARAYACAEVVANMVAANITGKEWVQPEWLPRHFLTSSRGESAT